MNEVMRLCSLRRPGRCGAVQVGWWVPAPFRQFSGLEVSSVKAALSCHTPQGHTQRALRERQPLDCTDSCTEILETR